MSVSLPRSPARHDYCDVDDLSNEQIKSLLHRAEQRLKTAEPSSHHNIGATTTLQSLPKLNVGPITQPYVSTNNVVAWADPQRLLNEEDREASNDGKRVGDLTTLGGRAVKDNHGNAGFDFFSMPATKVSPEFSADMRLLKVRNVLDPHRHYKKDSSKNFLPQFSEIGEIVEGPAEHYSARVPKKERHRTFVGEALANEASNRRFNRKFTEIQSSKTSGRKAYYKKLKLKRSGGI